MADETFSAPLRPVRCLNCGRPLPPDLVLRGTGAFRACGFCLRPHRVISFPALLRPLEWGRSGEHTQAGDEAACFFHPDKRAVTVCDECGRFLCALCDLPVKGRHICPSCFAGAEKTDETFLARRTRYDNLALAVALLPILILPPAVVITGPIAVYMAFRYWKQPCSLVESSHPRLALAAFFGLLEIAGIAALVIVLNSG